MNGDTDDHLTSAILGASALAQFENAYAAYAREAQRTAAAFLGDAQLAGDAVHNAYLEILRYLVNGGRWDHPEEARAVVLRNTRWAALNLLRSRRRRPGAASTISEVASDADDATWARWEARALCEQVLTRLRPDQRTALHLHFRECLSNPEAAARLGLTPSGFAARLQRAIIAAQRVARGSGILPGVASSCGAVLRRGGVALRRAAPALVGGGKLVGSAAAAALGIQCAVALCAPPRPPGITAHVVAARQTGTAVADKSPPRPHGAVVVDAIAVDYDTVLALGWARDCRCWVVSRTVDAGRHWEVSDGPVAQSPHARLGVGAASPHDARIVILDDSDGVTTTWVSPRFGAPFVASGVTVPLAVTVHMTNARMLPAGGHMLTFPGLGGVLCSADGGHRWQPTCAG